MYMYNYVVTTFSHTLIYSSLTVSSSMAAYLVSHFRSNARKKHIFTASTAKRDIERNPNT